jgi:hypothetical protein
LKIWPLGPYTESMPMPVEGSPPLSAQRLNVTALARKATVFGLSATWVISHTHATLLPVYLDLDPTVTVQAQLKGVTLCCSPLSGGPFSKTPGT